MFIRATVSFCHRPTPRARSVVLIDRRLAVMTAMSKLPPWWVSGKKGSLSPWTQAKVFALLTANEEFLGVPRC